MRLQIPKVNIGCVEASRLFLGDHGFLAQYGSRLSEQEIAERMMFATHHANVGLAAGDERCLQAFLRSKETSEEHPELLYHTDVRLEIVSESASFEKCMALLLAFVTRCNPHFVERDPIVGGFLRRYSGCQPYSLEDLAVIQLSEPWLEDERAKIEQFQPALVSVGGDYLDVLAACGRHDLVDAALARYAEICNLKRRALILTTYLGPAFGFELLKNRGMVAALMVPLNRLGFGMFPTANDLVGWLAAAGKPVLGMHVLASGAIKPIDGLPYAYANGVDACIVGASQPSHITALLEAAKASWPTSTESDRSAGTTARR